MKISVSNIQWDVDEDTVMPNSVHIETDKPIENLEDFVSDYLSDTSGFCHKGFVIDSYE